MFYMDTYTRVLVIILASVLAITLILMIMALVKIIQILNSLKKISAQAEKLADKVENISEFFRNSAATVAFSRLVGNIAEVVSKKTKRRKGKEDE